MPMRADRRREGEHAGLERRQAEAELEHQRQQEGHGADADAEERAADDRGAEHRIAEQLEIEQRIGCAACMAEVEQAATHARQPA